MFQKGGGRGADLSVCGNGAIVHRSHDKCKISKVFDITGLMKQLASLAQSSKRSGPSRMLGCSIMVQSGPQRGAYCFTLLESFVQMLIVECFMVRMIQTFVGLENIYGSQSINGKIVLSCNFHRCVAVGFESACTSIQRSDLQTE